MDPSKVVLIVIDSGDDDDCNEREQEKEIRVVAIKQEASLLKSEIPSLELSNSTSEVSTNDIHLEDKQIQERETTVEVSVPESSHMSPVQEHAATVEVSVPKSSHVTPVEECDNAATILSILTENPKDIEFLHKPAGIRKNTVLTLNKNTVSIKSLKADDNGAYSYNGNASKYFHFTKHDECRVLHHDIESDTYYYNSREGSVYCKVFVRENIYELTRMYSTSKNNPQFSRVICTIRASNRKVIEDYYLVIYKWKEGHENDDFITPRHGNATRPETPSYFRQDETIKGQVDELLDKGESTDKIYVTLGKMPSSTVSETLKNPKYIDNRKFSRKEVVPEEKRCEAELLLQYIKEDGFIRSINFTKDSYSTVNFLPQMLTDIDRFCVVGNGILAIDTTFEVCDGLYLTDTSYTNSSLVGMNGKHPEFPGPSFWHFRKRKEDFHRFAAELVVAKPSIIHLRKIGHDLDKAQATAMKDVFTSSTRLWCTQHIKGRDVEQLRKLGCSEKDRSRILADIYGTQNEILLQSGLADAEDPADLKVKLDSLRDIWDEISPSFYGWFVRNHKSYFEECLVLSAREELDIEGRYYTNGLELKHKLQKKKLREEDIPKEVVAVSEALKSWAKDNYFREAEKAIRGLGKYRLSKEYATFYKDPVQWNKQTKEKQEEITEKFFKYIPKAMQYEKPQGAGFKDHTGKNKRRIRLPDPEIFVDRVHVQGGSSEKIARIEEETDSELDDPYNPDRTVTNKYYLVHRQDLKLCPKKVKVCQSCRTAFTPTDYVLIRTVGTREYHDKNGKEKKSTGNIYIHFLKKCLETQEKSFKYSQIHVTKRTQELCPKSALDGYRKRKMKFDEV